MNRDYEFKTKLHNHEIEDKNIYRLFYIDYYRIDKVNDYNNIGSNKWAFKSFTLPDGMNKNDAFKVLSYLYDYVKEESGLSHNSFKSIAKLDEILDLEILGFRRLNNKVSEKDITNLYAVNGRLLLFKSTKYYDDYFNWYTKNISLEDVKNIYTNNNVKVNSPKKIKKFTK